MKCPGCKRDKDAISSLFRQCEHCGYIFKTIEENYAVNKTLAKDLSSISTRDDNFLINKIISHQEQLGTLNIGDKVKINIPEGVWHGASGIIIDKMHKYYRVQILAGNNKTSAIVHVLHNQVTLK